MLRWIRKRFFFETEFDPQSVNQRIKEAITADIHSLADIPPDRRAAIAAAAVKAVCRGRDLAGLMNALRSINLPEARAREISLYIHNRATALINQERQLALGINEAEWMYSGAPCMEDPRRPNPDEIRQDEMHKAADGKRFDIKKGMNIGGHYVFPGQGRGCKCVSKSVVPGFD